MPCSVSILTETICSSSGRLEKCMSLNWTIIMLQIIRILYSIFIFTTDASQRGNSAFTTEDLNVYIIPSNIQFVLRLGVVSMLCYPRPKNTFMYTRIKRVHKCSPIVFLPSSKLRPVIIMINTASRSSRLQTRAIFRLFLIKLPVAEGGERKGQSIFLRALRCRCGTQEKFKCCDDCHSYIISF